MIGYTIDADMTGDERKKLNQTVETQLELGQRQRKAQMEDLG
jgi:hypothetical protein